MRKRHALVLTVLCPLFIQFANAQQIQRGPMRLRMTPADTLVGNSGTVNYRAMRSFFRGTGVAGGERDVTTGGVWSVANPSANPNLVVINPTTGVATAAASGTGTSTVSIKSGPNHVSGPLQVTTSPAPTVSSVSVTPGSPTVPRGRGLALQATATYTGAGGTHDVTYESAWSSNASANVSVVPTTGQVQAGGLQGSTASITATFAATPGSTTVTVGAPVLASRLITPFVAGPIDLGSSQQFKVIDTMSDGTTVDQTASAAWSTGANTIATVNSTDRPGFATATGGGYTTVTGAGSLPAGMSVSLTASLAVNIPKPRYAYGINKSDQTISIFSVDAVSGQLTTVGYVPLTAQPGPLTIEPKGRFLYVALNSGSLLGFRIDAISGSLTPVPGSPYTTFSVLPGPLKSDPAGKFLYAMTSGIFSFGLQLFSIDSVTGALTAGNAKSAGSTGPSSTTIDPSGRFAFVTNKTDNQVLSFPLDPVTGNPGTPLTVPTGNQPSALWLLPSGKFGYVTNQMDGTVSSFSISGGTGAFTLVGTTPPVPASQPAGVTVDPKGRFVFAANSGSNSVTAYSDNGAGQLTQVGTVAAGTNPAAVKVDPQGQFLYVPNFGSNDISTYAIDGSTGALSSTGTIRAQGGILSLDILKGNPITQQTSIGYIGNLFSNNISAYYINQTNGMLSPLPGSPYATGGLNSQNCSSSGQNCQTGSPFLGIEPNHKFAYLANSISQNVSIFSIDPTSGALSPTAISPYFVGGGRLRGALAHPSQQVGYVPVTPNTCCAQPTVNVARLGSDGTPTPLQSAPSPVGGEGATIDPSGRFLYWVGDNCTTSCVGAVAGFQINQTPGPSLGTLTPVQGSPFLISGAAGGGPSLATTDPSGRFLIVPVQNQNGPCPCPPGEVAVFKINTSDFSVPSAGALTPVPGSPFMLATGEGAISATVDRSGRYVYVGVTSQTQPDGTGAVKQFSIDPSTGQLSFLGALPTFGFVTVALDPAGNYAYVIKGFIPGDGTDNVSVYVVDATTGALTTNVQNLNTGTSGSAGMTVLRRTQ